MWACMRCLFLVGLLPAVNDRQLSPCAETQRVDHLYVQRTFITALNLTMKYLDSVLPLMWMRRTNPKCVLKSPLKSMAEWTSFESLFSYYFNRNSCILVLLWEMSEIKRQRSLWKRFLVFFRHLLSLLRSRKSVLWTHFTSSASAFLHNCIAAKTRRTPHKFESPLIYRKNRIRFHI